MSELRTDGSIGINIRVTSQVPIHKFFPAIVPTGTEISPSQLDYIIEHNQPFMNSLDSSLLEKQQKQSPSPALQYSEDRAKDMVNITRTRMGLPVIEVESMKCVYFTEQEFAEWSEILELIDIESCTAANTYELSAEIVRTKNHPSYLIGSYVVHELIHRFIDYRTMIYRQKPAKGITGKDVVSYRQARCGLSVRDVKTDENKGTVLNELGNYFIQAEYIRTILQDKNPIIRSELETRNRLLNETYGDVQYISATINTDTGREQDVYLNRDKIHFDTDGNEIHSFFSLLYTQLADDLNDLCDKVEGEHFMALLLRAKANPSLTGVVKRVLDDAMGEGFFEKIREARYGNINDLLDLTQHVQDKLYSYE